MLKLMTDFRDYGPLLLTCLSQMPRFPSVAQHFFELYEFGSGITSDEFYPPSIGLSFFAWICVDHLPFQARARRRCVLSLLDKDCRGFEIFISEQNFLIATHYTKNSCFTVESTKPIVDSYWHSIGVVWSLGSLLAQNGTCSILVDGVVVVEAKMQFSSVDKMKIRIGCGLDMPSQGRDMRSSSSFTSIGMALGSLAQRVTRSNSSNQLGMDEKVKTTRSADRDETWGRPGPLYGLMGYNVLLDCSLTPKLVALLHSWGPNSLLQFQSTNSATSELQLHLQCYYHPKNADAHLVRNLAPNGRHDACLTGRTHGAIDIRGAVHALSGIAVLFPIIEHMKQWVIKERRSWRDPMRTNSYSELLDQSVDHVVDAEYHPVASFLQLVRRLLIGPEVALKILAVETSSFSVLGALLQRLSGHLIDGTCLFEIQKLAEEFDPVDQSALVSAIRHYLLFDFRVWVHSSYTTRVSHIQYLSTMIKDSRRSSKSKYGVQFMLDVIRTYCCRAGSVDLTLSSPRSSISSDSVMIMAEDESAVREAILSLIRFYMLKNSTVDEIDAVLSFIIACSTD